VGMGEIRRAGLSMSVGRWRFEFCACLLPCIVMWFVLCCIAWTAGVRMVRRLHHGTERNGICHGLDGLLLYGLTNNGWMGAESAFGLIRQKVEHATEWHR